MSSSPPRNTYEQPKPAGELTTSPVLQQEVPPLANAPGDVRVPQAGLRTEEGRERSVAEPVGTLAGSAAGRVQPDSRSGSQGDLSPEAQGTLDREQQEAPETAPGVASAQSGDAAQSVASAAFPESGRTGQGGIRITAQRFFCVLFLMAVAMPLSYLGGVMAGRQALEEELMRASVLPPDAPVGLEVPVPSDEIPPPILKPQELAFVRYLRAAPGEKVKAPAQSSALKAAVAPEQKAQVRGPVQGLGGEQTPAASTAGAQGIGGQALVVPMAPGMSPATASGGPPQPPAQQAELFDFVFQMAAFGNRSAAENLQMNLEAVGFRSRLEQSGRLHLVLLLSRGPLSRIREVEEVAYQLRLGAPIERSRRAVLQPVGQR